ncbi:hypothetical protein HPB49_006781 [Dermacentor silvarum]|uniref:Uncharacterized protein n=1 Tax=Dermacentor silvarum TaxID=543639 RepID=A0ACB8DWP7_DERSI|nr:hypothetical protein HPB49_006781 [Dermacentor silvarum]
METRTSTTDREHVLASPRPTVCETLALNAEFVACIDRLRKYDTSHPEGRASPYFTYITRVVPVARVPKIHRREPAVPAFRFAVRPQAASAAVLRCRGDNHTRGKETMVDISSPFLNLQKGTSVLLNVLNRADTNGDGVLAKEEFLNFFWDAILTEDELCELFDEINIHRTGFIDAGELSAFVWQHMGKFPGLLAALEDLSVAVRKGLQQMEKTYDASSIQEQFVSRFLVRETVFQLSKLTAALDASQKRLQEEGIPLIDGSDSSDDDGEALRSPTTSWHLRSHIYKTLQHQNIECLRKPEFLNTMEIPGQGIIAKLAAMLSSLCSPAA